MRTHRPRTRHLVLAVLAVLLLAAAGCEAAPPPGTSHSPSGRLEVVRYNSPWSGNCTTDPSIPVCSFPNVPPCALRGDCDMVWAEGWAWDWDSAFPVPVVFAVIQDGQLRWETSGFYIRRWRPDIQMAYGRGLWSGFSQMLLIERRPAVICAVAINVGPGDNTILGCQAFSAP